MAMVNALAKDSRWLQLEVCREYQRGKCSRTEETCKYAHPGQSVEVQNGRVVACYDSIKGRCNREKPPCKYFHPPQHLKDQLLINGRNHLALKNALLQQMPLQTAVLAGQLPVVAANSPGSLLNAVSSAMFRQGAPGVHLGVGEGGMLPTGPSITSATASANSTCSTLPALGSEHFLPALKAASSKQFKRVLYRATISPYFTNLPAMATASAHHHHHHQAYGAYPGPQLLPMSSEQLTSYGMMSAPTALMPNTATGAKSQPRTDRLEVCREFQRGNCKRQEQDCRYAHPPSSVQTSADSDGLVTVCMDFVKGRCTREQNCRYFHPPSHLQAQLKQQQQQHQQATAAIGLQQSMSQPQQQQQRLAGRIGSGAYPEPGYFLCLHQK